MPHSFSAPRCAPYSVFIDDRLVARVPDLVSLHSFLTTQRARWEEERTRLTQQRARHACGFAFARPLPDYPHPQVIDARGVERQEFCSPHRILRFFDCKLQRLGRMADHGWDGDHRPRGEPVPGTGARSSYGRLYYRRPATQGQRRQAFVIAEDGEPEFRGARRRSSLPTYWDDVPRRSWRDRNWKNFRATQWKG